MKALVIFDSMYGNTGKIAEAIGAGLMPCGPVEVLKVSEVTSEQITEADLLVIGSPTQKFRPLPAMNTWLKGLPAKSLSGKRIAVFDTRMTKKDVEAVKILSFFVRIFGYAAGAMEKQIMRSGGIPATSGEGFYVTGTEGPLVDGELERAKAWGRKLAG